MKPLIDRGYTRAMNRPQTHTHCMYIDHMHVPLVYDLEGVFQEYAQEYHIKECDKEPIFDWCIVESYARAFTRHNTRVVNHYRYDEAVILLELVRPSRLELTIDAIAKRFRHVRDTEVKIMSCGKDIWISAKIKLQDEQNHES